MRYIIFLIIIFYSNLLAYESENRLQTAIIGKVAKYIEWDTSKKESFIITVLNNQFEQIFDEVYKDKEIKNRSVKIVYIDNISQLQTSDILFISKANKYNIDKILEKTNEKKILTVSNIRGFAQKGGCLQLSFFEQKLKLKMNIHCMKVKGLKVNNTLLRVVEIVKRDNL